MKERDRLEERERVREGERIERVKERQHYSIIYREKKLCSLTFCKGLNKSRNYKKNKYCLWQDKAFVHIRNQKSLK